MGWWDAVLDVLAVLMPVDCAGCGIPDRALCAACRAELEALPVVRTVGDLRVVTALRYEGAVRRVILALKEQNRTDVATALAAPLAAAVGRALTLADSEGVELVAVPTSRLAYRRRGYDPVALVLARRGIRSVRVLRHSRSTARQKALGAADRARNLHGALAARHALAGRKFVVVDDILTTGATMREAARAIEAAGGEVVLGAALAFTPRLLAFRDNADGEDYGGAKGAMNDRLDS